jgi:superfamily II DNA helicase RecQ
VLVAAREDSASSFFLDNIITQIIYTVQIKIITVPISDNGTMQAELNKFLSVNRVLEVEQHFFQNGNGGCWSFCIRYMPQVQNGIVNGSKEKVDYKQILSEKEFAIFSYLRVIRKQLADEDSIPAYAVFTDEELAGIAQLPELTAEKLTTVQGIGAKKVQKYGKNLVERYLQSKTTERGNPANEEGKLFT